MPSAQALAYVYFGKSRDAARMPRICRQATAPSF